MMTEGQSDANGMLETGNKLQNIGGYIFRLPLF